MTSLKGWTSLRIWSTAMSCGEKESAYLQILALLRPTVKAKKQLTKWESDNIYLTFLQHHLHSSKWIQPLWSPLHTAFLARQQRRTCSAAGATRTPWQKNKQKGLRAFLIWIPHTLIESYVRKQTTQDWRRLFHVATFFVLVSEHSSQLQCDTLGQNNWQQNFNETCM